MRHIQIWTSHVAYMKKPGETGDDLGRVALDAASTFSSHALGEVTKGGAAKRDFLFTVNGANEATLMLQVHGGRCDGIAIPTMSNKHSHHSTPPHHHATAISPPLGNIGGRKAGVAGGAELGVLVLATGQADRLRPGEPPTVASGPPHARVDSLTWAGGRYPTGLPHNVGPVAAWNGTG